MSEDAIIEAVDNYRKANDGQWPKAIKLSSGDFLGWMAGLARRTAEQAPATAADEAMTFRIGEGGPKTPIAIDYDAPAGAVLFE